jgi:DNA-binding GntR family transcriptional regulator
MNSDSPNVSAAVPTLATNLHHQIRTDLLAGRFDPGSKLAIEALAAHYSVGLTPVREALNRLTSEGLVQRRDQRGFAVAEVSAADLAEITMTRCWLEEIALRKSIEQRTAEWEETLVLAHHRLSRVQRSLSKDKFEDNPEWEPQHRAFHRALIGNCGSRWLVGFCEQLSDQLYRYRQLAVNHAFPTRHEGDEHRAIVEAVLAGQADEAVALMQAHYQRTADMIRQAPAVFDNAPP